MATTHLDDINVIITDNTAAPNAIAAHPDEDTANATATADTATPRARTRSITAAQKVVKKDLKYYMDRVNLLSVESIITMCNIIEDGVYYFHKEIVDLSKIKHRGDHELAVQCISSAKKEERSAYRSSNGTTKKTGKL